MTPKQTQAENLTNRPPDSKEDESDSDNPRTAEVTEVEKALLTNVRLEVERVSDAKETEKDEENY